MFTMLVFKSIWQMVAFYGVIFVILGAISFFVYKKATATRKFYRCTNCAESFRTEFMEAQSCKVCGGSLELVDDENITDKAL